jgi:hypothetical protein
MTTDLESSGKVEIYLGELRKNLRCLKREEIDEIVQELRSHIVEKATTQSGLTPSTVNSVLARLGDPRELAGRYLADNLLGKPQVRRSPFRMITILFRWASLTLAGTLIFFSAIAGYFIGASLVLCGLLKAIHPHTAGVWTSHDASGDLAVSVRLGFGSAPVGAKEVLGWWIIPVGILVGTGLVILTTKWTLWCVRRFRGRGPLGDSQDM